MQQLADALLHDPSVRTSPLLVNLVHFVTDFCRDYAHPSIDRIWLGTWNPSILHACLSYGRSPTYQVPARLPHSLVQQFDRIFARLQCELLRGFLRLHAFAQQRSTQTPTRTRTSTSHAVPTSSRPRLQQTRLTKIWQVSPPCPADVPAPLKVSQPKQQLLTAYMTAPATTQAPTPLIIEQPNPPPALHCTPAPTQVPTTYQRRRRGSAPSRLPACNANITHYFSRRAYTPHVATNPVNSTPDHDPDKQ